MITYDMVQRKDASTRHVVKQEKRVRRFPSRYEAMTWCDVTIRGEYPTARGQRSDVSCTKCLRELDRYDGAIGTPPGMHRPGSNAL